MLAWFFDVEEDAERYAAMFFLCSLAIVPVPGVLAWAPLEPLSACGPCTVKSDVESVVF